MPINGTVTLGIENVQKKMPKGKAVESELESDFKGLEKIKSKYPDKFEAKKMSFGSKGEAFGG